jgi:hypothetical protein
MNEQEFIRQQVSTERAHMGATRAALGAALAANYPATVIEPFARAAARYLVFVVRRFNAQDLEHCAILRPLIPATDLADRTTLDDLAETLGLSGSAIDALAAALNAPAADLLAASGTYNQFYAEVLVRRRHAIYHLFERHYGIAEWRRASFVDADSILAERELYAAVGTTLPAGLELRSPGRPTNTPGP